VNTNKQYLAAHLAPPEGIPDANGNHCNRLKKQDKSKNQHSFTGTKALRKLLVKMILAKYPRL